MKRIAYSFFLVALFSCGSPPSSSTNRIVIQFRDSVIRDFYLLSVHDHGLVVAPYVEENAQIGSLIDSAHEVPFSKIEALYNKSRANSSDIIGSGFTGGLLGTGCGIIFAIPVSFGENGDARQAAENFSFSVGSGILTGIALGILRNTSDKQFFLDTKDHLDEVRQRAVYPHYEPFELLQKR